MKKKIMPVLMLCAGLLIGVLIGLVPSILTVHAEDETEETSEISGTCGDDLIWVLDEDTGTLTISGSGEMTSYSSLSSVP